MSNAPPDPIPRGTWAALFHQTSDPIFLLNPRRRVRYVNRAFETIAKSPADAVVHEYCHPRKIQKDLPATRRALLQTLAPPSEVFQGRVVKVRRPVPPAKLGPPWWDITFVPLREGDKLLGVFGTISVIGPPVPTAGGKGLSEAIVALRQRTVDRVSLSLFDSELPDGQRVRAQAELASKTLAPVWIIGAPGTGKETLARAIHYYGVTRERAFASIDCDGLQPFLIRSIMFGHNGLAETGRVGTIYLKSPEAIPTDLRAELMEWGELLAEECRVVVGSSGASAVNDLRAAFGVIEIRLPSLMDLKSEFEILVARVRQMLGINEITPEALAVLQTCKWLGNFRELREVLRDSAKRAGDDRIDVSHLPQSLRKSATDARMAATAARPAVAPNLDEVLLQVEKRMIEVALRKSRGDQTAAADTLGIHRSRLVRRVKALGLGE